MIKKKRERGEGWRVVCVWWQDPSSRRLVYSIVFPWNFSQLYFTTSERVPFFYIVCGVFRVSVVPMFMEFFESGWFTGAEFFKNEAWNSKMERGGPNWKITSFFFEFWWPLFNARTLELIRILISKSFVLLLGLSTNFKNFHNNIVAENSWNSFNSLCRSRFPGVYYSLPKRNFFRV